MKEEKNNVSETKEKEEVMFLKDSKVVINNEVKTFKEKSVHKFEKEIASKLVSQNNAQYTSKEKKNKEES